jgi:hypothetical protein
MKPLENENWLDEALTKAVGCEKSQPDFEKWKQDHPEAVEMLTSRARREPAAFVRPLRLRRIIMYKTITKLAAAAIIIIGVTFGLTTLLNHGTPAYALDQTIEANHSVRYLHIKDFYRSHQDEPKEFWVECDEFGQIKNARLYMPEWDAPEDGAKVGVWNDGIAQVWFKKKNSILIFRNKTVAAMMLKLVEQSDPRLAVQRLYELQQQGKVKIAIDEPSDKAEPIVVTATYPPEDSRPGRRHVLYVDQATKLVNAIEFYQLKDGQYEYQGVQEHYDYNVPIDAKMFALDDEVPADVIRVDQVTQEVGLAQGELTGEQVAVEVVRQFFEALIKKDYEKAGMLFGGIPASNIQQWYGKLNVVRIVSIDKPRPHPIPGVGGFVVPCEVELQAKDGTKSIWKPYGPAVRPVDPESQPHRWNLHGGI